MYNDPGYFMSTSSGAALRRATRADNLSGIDQRPRESLTISGASRLLPRTNGEIVFSRDIGEIQLP